MSHPGRRVVAGALAAATLLIGAATAGADGSPRVAMEPDGTAHLSWRETYPDRTTGMRERSWTPAGAFSPSRALSTGTGGWAFGGEIAVDPAGAVTYTWDRGTEPETVYARRRGADGSLGPLQTISARDSGEAVVAAGPRGGAVFAWRRTEQLEKPSAVVQMRRRHPSGALGPIRTLSASASGTLSLRPDVAVDSAGNALVVWQKHAGGSVVVQARWVGADGSLGALRTLTAPALGVEHPRVTFDGNGNAYVTWLRSQERRWVPELARRSPGGAYSATQPLWTSDESANDLQLAVTAGGAATATWSSFVGETGNVVFARHRAADGALGPVMTLSVPGNSSYHPQVAMDPRGGATFAWAHQEGGHGVIQARRRSASGGMSTIQTLSAMGDASDPQLGVDQDGNALVMWTHQLYDESFIQARRRTAAALLGRIERVSD